MEYIKKIGEFFYDDTRKMQKNDWIIILIIVLLYSIISFINLGSLKNPQTFAQFKDGNSAIIEIKGDAKFVSKIRHYSGEEPGTFRVYGSFDGEEYEEITEYTDKYAFLWDDTEINEELKYLKITAMNKNSYIGEIGVYDENNNLIEMIASSNKDKLLIDEMQNIPKNISYMNSTYFDEIYFARSAYEYANDMSAYEWVHPPLGKLIQMIPIVIFGMTPFAYRLMGNIAGILMVFVMYIFGKNLFKSRKYALLTALIMMFDNFHFAQTRMGTVDSFLVLFIIVSALFMFKYLLLRKR